jgi:hypothetical protein
MCRNCGRETHVSVSYSISQPYLYDFAPSAMIRSCVLSHLHNMHFETSKSKFKFVGLVDETKIEDHLCFLINIKTHSLVEMVQNMISNSYFENNCRPSFM